MEVLKVSVEGQSTGRHRQNLKNSFQNDWSPKELFVNLLGAFPWAKGRAFNIGAPKGQQLGFVRGSFTGGNIEKF